MEDGLPKNKIVNMDSGMFRVSMDGVNECREVLIKLKNKQVNCIVLVQGEI